MDDPNPTERHRIQVTKSFSLDRGRIKVTKSVSVGVSPSTELGRRRRTWLGTLTGGQGVILLALSPLFMYAGLWLFAALLIVVGLTAVGYAKRMVRRWDTQSSADGDDA